MCESSGRGRRDSWSRKLENRKANLIIFFLLMFIHEIHVTWYPRIYWAIIKLFCSCTSYASSSNCNKAFWKRAYSMRALVTSGVQLQSLVLAVGRGKQEKDTGSGDKASWRGWGLRGRYLVFRKINGFVKGSVNFQPKNNHWTSQLWTALALVAGSHGPLP